MLNGIDAAIHDPDPDTERKAYEVLDNAERAFVRLFGDSRPARGALRIAASVADAVEGAGFIQESVPERLDLKRTVLAEIDAAAPPDVVIGSSTSGLLPSDMQRDLAHPERMLVGHPFNPVYLLPLVEIVGGRATSAAAVERARDVYASVGMKPVVVAKEIDAFIGDRLQEALWREALWLVHDGIATVEDIDDVIRYSFGLRWRRWVSFRCTGSPGGEAGMRHFMEQFGPCLAWPWTKLTDVPDLDVALVDKIAEQSDTQAAGLSIRELERIRDDNLVGIMKRWSAPASPAGAPAPCCERRGARCAPRRRLNMDFGLTTEQQMVVDTVRGFVEKELYPHEEEVERTGQVPPELGEAIKRKIIDLGFHAPNLPVEVGGGGLDHLTFTLLERELGRASMALSVFWGRPSGILMGCDEGQRERYLYPAALGERVDALAMTEPGAGSDVRGMQCFARRDGDDWIVNGTKHFISHADLADFVIVFVATGEEETARGPKKRITCFLVDRGTPGFEIRPGL